MNMDPIHFTIRPYQVQDEQAVIELWHTCGLMVPQNVPCEWSIKIASYGNGFEIL